jgi:Cu/Ag efflux protein CusF
MKSIVVFAITGLFAVLAPGAAQASETCRAPAADSAKEDHSHCGVQSADAPAPGAVYKATGSVKRVDKATGKVTIAHGAVAELNWPAMTMRFGVSDRKLLDELAEGRKVDFRFVQRGSDYIVTALY